MPATDHQVVVIGTGFAGLCTGIKLKEAGIEDFVIVERADGVGGTWRDNSYPGAACDVPARLYSFSFAQKSDWSRTYPTQPELKAYLEGVARDHQLLPHIRFNHNVEDLRWDDAAQHWVIKTSAATLTARVVVSGNGGLAEPKTPDIPGIETFRGHSFHSATWDHDYDLRGKRIAVIGTGASAIQFVPEIAKQAGRLDVYQRTPNWIIPRPDKEIPQWQQWLMEKVPMYRNALRSLVYCGHEARVVGIVLNPALMKFFQKIAANHLKSQVADRTLRQKLTPNYLIGCKRILISNDWYPTMTRDNVELITSGIAEVRDHSVVDQEGNVREVDAIIYGTGFYATENPIAAKVFGRNGQSLASSWADGEHAYLGTAVPGFPNLFFLTGPNTGLGHSSMVLMIEAQVRYVMQALASALNEHQPLEVRPEVETAYNDKLQKKLGSSVWSTECDSWYKHRNGKITTLWPGFTFGFMRTTRRFKRADYLARVG